jgi:hypothetical protein
MNTNDLIENLARGLEPSPALPSPGRRAATWSLGAAAYFGLLVVAMSVMFGEARAADPLFLLPQAVALAAAVLASLAAFASVVPAAANRARVWAAGAALMWLATLVAASPGQIDWSAVAGANHEWFCVGVIVIGGAPPAVVLTWMLGRGAPLNPAVTAALAALATALLANVTACLAVPHSNGAVTFSWHGGLALALVLVAASIGRFVFTWRRGAAREAS